jgi:hypothetical protein
MRIGAPVGLAFDLARHRRAPSLDVGVGRTIAGVTSGSIGLGETVTTEPWLLPVQRLWTIQTFGSQ